MPDGRKRRREKKITTANRKFFLASISMRNTCIELEKNTNDYSNILFFLFQIWSKMGNDNQFIEQPGPPFVNPVTSKDGIIAIQTPIEPLDSRQTLLNEKKLTPKTSHTSSSSFKSTDKLFALFLFILLIILFAYILFHGRIVDMKLNRLINNYPNEKSSDLRSLLEEMNRTLRSIERLLNEQSKKTNINLQLNGQDIREFYTNQTVLYEVLRRLKERS